jgi:hypothetical protein
VVEVPRILISAAGGVFVVLWVLAAGMLLGPRVPLPLPVRFVSGAVAVSTSVFALVTVHAGYLVVWLSLGTGIFGIALWRYRSMTLPVPARRLPAMNWWFRALFACYGLVYLAYVFAPEIQPDAVAYHLGLVQEYVRLHSFPNRVGFYEMLPQGVEMLFVPAFAIGAHSAAKLVHFSFLVVTVAIIRHICLELEIPDIKACCASAIFLIAPVTAIASTSAYTDAALVCCCCSVFYLAIRWDRKRTRSLLAIGALNAGFCYAIKPTFGWVTLAVFGLLIYRSRKALPAVLFVSAAGVAILPWTIRAALMTGDPFAPFLNAWFPNAAFTPRLESKLFDTFSAFRPSFSWDTAMLDYTILGGNEGLLGPVFLLAPLAFLALRTRPGRWLLGAAALLAVPMVSNTGTRFLMPAAALASIALVSVVPAPVAIALVVVQMIGSSTSVIDLYDTRHDWRLREIPWRAALGLEKEQDYLTRNLIGFANNRMLAELMPPGAQIFSLAPVQQAYVDRHVLGYWHSRLADAIFDRLQRAQQAAVADVSGGIRREATGFMRRSGYRYILVPTGKGQFSEWGKGFLEHPVEWGVVPAGHNEDDWLFYIPAEKFNAALPGPQRPPAISPVLPVR